MVNKSFDVKTLQDPRGILLTTKDTVLHALLCIK